VRKNKILSVSDYFFEEAGLFTRATQGYLAKLLFCKVPQDNQKPLSVTKSETAEAVSR
jgi:hypothetical protein